MSIESSVTPLNPPKKTNKLPTINGHVIPFRRPDTQALEHTILPYQRADALLRRGLDRELASLSFWALNELGNGSSMHRLGATVDRSLDLLEAHAEKHDLPFIEPDESTTGAPGTMEETVTPDGYEKSGPSFETYTPRTNLTIVE